MTELAAHRQGTGLKRSPAERNSDARALMATGPNPAQSTLKWDATLRG